MNRSCFNFALTFIILAMPAGLAAQTLYAPGGTVGTSSNGNVGIGTASPLGVLDIQNSSTGGHLLITSEGTNSYNTINSLNNAGNAYIGIVMRTPGLSIYDGTNPTPGVISGATAYFSNVGSVTGVDLTLLADYVARMTVQHGTGNVGIGTTNPDSPLRLIKDLGNTAGVNDLATFTHAPASPGSAGVGLGYWSSGTTKVAGAIRSTGALPLYLTTTAATAQVAIATSGNVGIGTTAPSGKLSVVGTGGDGRSVTLDTSEIKFRGDGVAHISIYGPTTGKPYLSIGDTSGSYLPGYASAEAFVVTSSGRVGIGTTNPTYPLSVNGAIEAKELIVQTGWSDYVFGPGYHLASLDEVKKSIAREGHLPGIPSAKEVAEHGVNVGEMQAKLLAKIEELTLHQIEQEKKLAEQSAQLSTQSHQLAAQSSRIERLETENAALKQSH